MASEISRMFVSVGADVNQAIGGLDAVDQRMNRMQSTTRATGGIWDGFIGGFAKVGLAVTGVMGIVGAAEAGYRAVSGFIGASAEAELSTQKLDKAITNTGVTITADYQTALENSIDRMSKFSGFAKTEVRSALSIMVAETGNVKDSMFRMSLAQDLARGTGLGLYAASRLLGRVTDENVNVLRRYGVFVAAGAKQTDLFAAIQKKFGGQATIYANSTAGQMERVKLQFEDLKIMLSAALLPVVTRVFAFLNTALERVMRIVPQIVNNFKGFFAIVKQVQDAIGGAFDAILGRGPNAQSALTSIAGPAGAGAILSAFKLITDISDVVWSKIALVGRSAIEMFGVFTRQAPTAGAELRKLIGDQGAEGLMKVLATAGTYVQTVLFPAFQKGATRAALGISSLGEIFDVFTGNKPEAGGALTELLGDPKQAADVMTTVKAVRTTFDNFVAAMANAWDKIIRPAIARTIDALRVFKDEFDKLPPGMKAFLEQAALAGIIIHQSGLSDEIRGWLTAIAEVTVGGIGFIELLRKMGVSLLRFGEGFLFVGGVVMTLMGFFHLLTDSIPPLDNYAALFSILGGAIVAVGIALGGVAAAGVAMALSVGIAVLEVIKTVVFLKENWDKFTYAWSHGMLDSIPLIGGLFAQVRGQIEGVVEAGLGLKIVFLGVVGAFAGAINAVIDGIRTVQEFLHQPLTPRIDTSGLTTEVANTKAELDRIRNEYAASLIGTTLGYGAGSSQAAAFRAGEHAAATVTAPAAQTSGGGKLQSLAPNLTGMLPTTGTDAEMRKLADSFATSLVNKTTTTPSASVQDPAVQKLIDDWTAAARGGAPSGGAGMPAGIPSAFTLPPSRGGDTFTINLGGITITAKDSSLSDSDIQRAVDLAIDRLTEALRTQNRRLGDYGNTLAP